MVAVGIRQFSHDPQEKDSLSGLPKTGGSLIKLPLGQRYIRSDESLITSPSRLSRPIGRDTRLLDNNEKVYRGKY